MLVAIYRKILRRNKQGKAPRCDALLGALVRVTRLERAISASQMRRGTNSATPGYSLSCHDTTARGKNKVFSVCGHLCGQSRFCAVFSNRGKSRKRRRRKALRRFVSPYPGYNHGTPKLCVATLLTIPAFYAFCKRGKRCGWVEFVGLQYILNKSITQDMACRQSNEVRGEIRREPCQPEI